MFKQNYSQTLFMAFKMGLLLQLKGNLVFLDFLILIILES